MSTVVLDSFGHQRIHQKTYKGERKQPRMILIPMLMSKKAGADTVKLGKAVSSLLLLSPAPSPPFLCSQSRVTAARGGEPGEGHGPPVGR